LTRPRNEEIKFISSTTTNECDQEIFSVLWGTLIAAISLVFETTKTKEIVAMTIEGFHLCAKIGAHFGLSQVVDNLVVSLCKFSKLNANDKGNKPLLSLSYEMKPQDATIALFHISTTYADHIREGWKNVTPFFLFFHFFFFLKNLKKIKVVDCLLCLNRYKLLDSLINLPTFLKPKKQTTSVTPQPNHNSFFGSLWGSGSWWTNNEKQSQISEEISNAQNSAKKILERCNINLFLEVTSFLEKDSLAFLIKTLNLVFEETTKRLKTNNNSEGEDKERDALLCLDLLTKMTLFNRNRISLVWENVHQLFFFTLTNKDCTSTVCERATINLLLLCIELINTHHMVDSLLETIHNITQIYSNSSTATVCDTLSLALVRLLENNKEVLMYFILFYFILFYFFKYFFF
jgi:golgi-specific brefeldin A-resistance guanine nucleotide exchange factor 1